jgi:hypothetical protein
MLILNICRHIFAVDWPIVTCRSFQGDWANARSKDVCENHGTDEILCWSVVDVRKAV